VLFSNWLNTLCYVDFGVFSHNVVFSSVKHNAAPSRHTTKPLQQCIHGYDYNSGFNDTLCQTLDRVLTLYSLPQRFTFVLLWQRLKVEGITPTNSTPPCVSFTPSHGLLFHGYSWTTVKFVIFKSWLDISVEILLDNVIAKRCTSQIDVIISRVFIQSKWMHIWWYWASTDNNTFSLW